MLAEADMATVFHQIMDEQHKELDLEITPQQGRNSIQTNK